MTQTNQDVQDRLARAVTILRARANDVRAMREPTLSDPCRGESALVSVRFRNRRYFDLRQNVRMAARDLFGRWPQWQRELLGMDPTLRNRLVLAQAALRRRERCLPDVEVGGAVLAWWAEDGWFIATMTPQVALATAAMLEDVAQRAASGNGVPALRGAGLEPALEVADQVIMAHDRMAAGY